MKPFAVLAAALLFSFGSGALAQASPPAPARVRLASATLIPGGFIVKAQVLSTNTCMHVGITAMAISPRPPRVFQAWQQMVGGPMCGQLARWEPKLVRVTDSHPPGTVVLRASNGPFTLPVK